MFSGFIFANSLCASVFSLKCISLFCSIKRGKSNKFLSACYIPPSNLERTHCQVCLYYLQIHLYNQHITAFEKKETFRSPLNLLLSSISFMIVRILFMSVNMLLSITTNTLWLRLSILATVKSESFNFWFSPVPIVLMTSACFLGFGLSLQEGKQKTNIIIKVLIKWRTIHKFTPLSQHFKKNGRRFSNFGLHYFNCSE